MRCCCLCTALLAGLVLGSLGGLLARLATRIKLARQPRDAIKRSSKHALAKRLRSRLPNATSGRGKQRLRSGDTLVHRPKTQLLDDQLPTQYPHGYGGAASVHLHAAFMTRLARLSKAGSAAAVCGRILLAGRSNGTRSGHNATAPPPQHTVCMLSMVDEHACPRYALHLRSQAPATPPRSVHRPWLRYEHPPV